MNSRKTEITIKELLEKRKKELVEKIRKVRQSLIFVSGLQINVNNSIRNLNRSLKVSYFDLAQQEEAALSATETSFRECSRYLKILWR
jgi:translation initiation factor 2B subunit (eIF-2B alpha/beta/delta family)